MPKTLGGSSGADIRYPRGIPHIAPSLGGVESLIEQAALMSFYELSTEERLQVGIEDTLIRRSAYRARPG